MRLQHCSLLFVPALSFALAVTVTAADLPYFENFDGTDGSPWPAPWFAGGSHVTVWDLNANSARLNGDPGFVSRMILPGYAALDVEVEVTVEFEDVVRQGFGFYVRQNGGTLQEYVPHGQGYAMFLKGAWAWPDDLGLWREIDGVETQFASAYNPLPSSLESGVRYRLRYRVTQSGGASTLLQARVWPDGSQEPATWTIEATDGAAPLQGTPGSFAIDIYNHSGTGHLYIDDLTIREYPYPSSVPQTDDTARLFLSTPRPNPASGRTEIDLVLPAREQALFTVIDPSGREVARPFSGLLGPGAVSLAFTPNDASGARLAPGIYFLRLVAGARSARGSVVVID